MGLHRLEAIKEYAVFLVTSRGVFICAHTWESSAYFQRCSLEHRSHIKQTDRFLVVQRVVQVHETDRADTTEHQLIPHVS